MNVGLVFGIPLLSQSVDHSFNKLLRFVYLTLCFRNAVLLWGALCLSDTCPRIREHVPDGVALAFCGSPRLVTTIVRMSLDLVDVGLLKCTVVSGPDVSVDSSERCFVVVSINHVRGVAPYLAFVVGVEFFGDIVCPC